MNEQPEEGHLVFAVHRHQATTLHDDFRLEIGGVMRTSAIPWGPTLDPHQKRNALGSEHALLPDLVTSPFLLPARSNSLFSAIHSTCETRWFPGR